MRDTNDYDLEPLLTKLRPHVQALESHLTAFAPRAPHWAADVMFYGFLSESLQCTIDTLTLATSDNPASAGHPNARLSFEAAEDALLLATSASMAEFDRDGALAYVFMKLEASDLDSLLAPGDHVDYQAVADQIEKEAKVLDGYAANSGDFIRRALAQLRAPFEAATGTLNTPPRGRFPIHWFEGKSRKLIAREIGQRTGDQKLEQELIKHYKHLSMHGHPRLRIHAFEKLSGRTATDSVDGKRGKHLAVAYALFAVSIANTAAERWRGQQ